MMDDLNDTSVVEQDGQNGFVETPDPSADGDGSDGGDPAATSVTPVVTATSVENWWDTPEFQAYSENLRRQARSEVETEFHIRSEQARISEMDDEEYGRYVREQQTAHQGMSQAQEAAARQVANKVWSDLCSVPEFRELSREEQAAIYYTRDGNPYIALSNKLAEKKAEKIVKAKGGTVTQAEAHLDAANANRGEAPVTGATRSAPVGALSEDADWSDVWAAKDRAIGRDIHSGRNPK